MSFISRTEIEKRFQEIFPDLRLSNEERKELFGNASFDLRLGNEIYVTRSGLPQRLDIQNEWVSITPGEFALLITHEKIKIPRNLIGFISMKLKYTVLGLINISGFHVDPGYEGKIVFSVYNAGPNEMILRYKEPMFIIFFSKLEPEAGPYEGRHQNMRGLLLEHVTSLKGPSEPFSKIIERITKLENIGKIDRGIIYTLLGVVVTLVVLIIKKFL